MNIGRMINYGTWNSKKDRINKSSSTEYRNVELFEFELIISGDGTLLIENQAYKAVPNLLVIAKPGSIRRSIFDFKTYYLHIDIDSSFEYYETLCNLPDFAYTTRPKVYMQIFIDIISFLLDNNSDTDSLYFKAKFLELIYLLQEDSKNNVNLLNNNMYQTNKLIRKVIDYIEKNYSERITLDTLAKITNYSPNYLQHTFSEITGMSPNEYLTSERIKNAKQLLIGTNKSIADISYECGFSSQAYFTKIFKINTLCTPMEYRRMLYEKSFIP